MGTGCHVPFSSGPVIFCKTCLHPKFCVLMIQFKHTMFITLNNVGFFFVLFFSLKEMYGFGIHYI